MSSPNHPSSSPTRSSRPATARPASGRKKSAIGAVVGAVVGGVIGAVLVKKARSVNPKKMIPAKLPALGRRALGAVKDVAYDAKTIAAATAEKAADQALSQMKTAAQQFVVDVARGNPPTPAALPAPVASTKRKRSPSPPKKPAAIAKKSMRRKPAAKAKTRTRAKSTGAA